MLDGAIVNFELNLPLPANARDATISPSTYWGIVVARGRRDPVIFAGRDQEQVLAVIVDSAKQATQEAVADNDRRDLDSPGTINGRRVVRRPGGRIQTLEG